MLKAAWREVAASLYCAAVDISRQLRSIRATNSTIMNRAESFAAKIRACGGRFTPKRLASTRGKSRALSQSLLSSFGGQLYQCPEGHCSTARMNGDKTNLRRLARDVAWRQKQIKLEAIRVCRTRPHPPGHVDPRKNTDDYLRILLRAIATLPDSITRCP
jgi:hypothetical protein